MNLLAELDLRPAALALGAVIVRAGGGVAVALRDGGGRGGVGLVAEALALGALGLRLAVPAGDVALRDHGAVHTAGQRGGAGGM